MQVYLFGFSKKKNSTMQPAISIGTQFTMQLKDETSVMNPVMLLNQNTSGMPAPFTPSYYTYAYIPKFNRYYFVTDWQWVNGLWNCYMSEDVLASFKTAIGNTTAYIERAASTYDGSIIDKLYPATTDVTISNGTIGNSWSGVAPSGGCYVVGIVNYQNANHVGAITYYALTGTELNSLLAFMFSNNIYQSGSITEIGEDLFKSLFNPFQYIVSCMWFPAAANTYGSTTTTVKIGYWDTGVTGVSVNALMDVRHVTGYVDAHPQASSRGTYLNYAPYTRITLFCPPFGEIPIDPTFTRKGRYLYAKVVIDVITGQATLRVAFRPNSSIQTDLGCCIEKTAMMGVPIQLAQVLSDYSSSISTLTSGLTSGSIAGIVGSIIGATVNSAIETQAPKVMSNGANGSFINFALEPQLVMEYYSIADEDIADLGRPLMKKRKINTLAGYIKCADAHFSASCFDSERDAVNTFMMEGFFYE